MVKLVVTADDFGLSKGVNGGILAAFRGGIVRSTALMVNFPDVEESSAELRKAEGLDVGIHLNLTSGPPVSSPDTVPSLVGSRGTFPGLFPFFGRVGLGRIHWPEVESEWRAQIKRGHQLGFKFSSINSHQHIHMLPALAKIASSLAREHGIPVVRLSSYYSTSLFRSPDFKTRALNLFAGRVRRHLREERIFFNDALLGIPAFPAAEAVERLCRRLQGLPTGIYELVCHPGFVDRDLEARDGYTAERLIDLEVVAAPKIRALFNTESMRLMTYRDLTPAENS
jgi:predicted glycoside hydrolase/deacetylase ChbG (UPF0249 family)